MNDRLPAAAPDAGAPVFARRPLPQDVLGRLATSRSGRDAGSVYLVVGVESPTAVFVADGRTRGVGRPKRKNVKHLEFGAPAAGLAARLASGPAVTDEEIRAAIAAAAVPG